MKQSGFSLFELLVAIVISSLLLISAASLFISNKRVYNESDFIGRLQENARFTVELLTKDIRMASFIGCIGNDFDKFSSFTGTPINSKRLAGMNQDNMLEGYESNNGSWLPSGSQEGLFFDPFLNNPPWVIGTDGITVRYIAPIANGIVNAMGRTAYSNQFFAATNANTYINRPFAIMDCNYTDSLIITGAGGSSPQGNEATWGNKDIRDYRQAQLGHFTAVRYMIRNGPRGPALYQTVLGQAIDTNGDGQVDDFQSENVELVQGVENMQILYGEDTDGDGAPNRIEEASGVNDWNNVTMVSLSLLFRTLGENFHGDRDTKSYVLPDLQSAVIPPRNDFHQRRVVNMSINIRNRVTSI